MLTLVQTKPNQSRRRAPKKPDVRTKTLQAMHATWRKICPLEGEELRDARLEFATQALGLRKPLKSTSKLSPAQLGRILDAMRERERKPSLPGIALTTEKPTPLSPSVSSVVKDSAEIVHLATDAQAEAIDKLIRYMRWAPDYAEKFIAKRFNGRKSARLLSPKDANSLTNILLNIAAHKRIKSVYEQLNVAIPTISKQKIHAEVPALKREIGIDQSAARARRGSFGSNEDYDEMVKGAAFK